jgi:hypothetical protein
MPRMLIIVFCFIIPLQLSSQILPIENSKLNYRLIGFSFPVDPNAIKYTIEIAAGAYDVAGAFAKNISLSVDSKTNRLIAEVPSFGKQYTWRIVYTDKKKVSRESALYHFSTMMNPHVDTGKLRLRILLPAAPQYKDDYVAVDGGGVVYDMKGRPVWFIPDTNGFGGNVACLQFTPQGTITFIYRSAYEINYNGDILWQTPHKGIINGDTVHGEYYHHEFTKLANGHFMALVMQMLLCKTVSVKDSNYLIISKDKDKTEANGYKLGRFGALVEYDEKGNAVWSWESSKYLPGADFAYFNPTDTNTKYDAHENAFYFDERNKVIYLGFRNLNRIIKIAYPAGKVLGTYGENFKPGAKHAGEGDGLFCNQHSIGRTQDGYLYYFNNNSCRNNEVPSVVMLQEPVSLTDTLKKVWEYSCPVEGDYKNFVSGGNATELPDRSLFVNMGSKYSKLLIVNRDKKILWSALPEKYEAVEQRWLPMHEYRATIISREEMERLIWGASDTKSVR